MTRDRPLHWREAEDMLGHRVDRRRTYVLADGQVCALVGGAAVPVREAQAAARVFGGERQTGGPARHLTRRRREP